MKHKSQDYREYLKDLIEIKKSKRSANSSADYARRLKISRSFLAQVFTKKKHLSLEKLNDLCSLLKLSPGESMALLENFLEQVHGAKHLTTAVRKAKIQCFLREKSMISQLPEQSQEQKKVLGDPLKSILFTLCFTELTLTQIQKSLHIKNFTTAELKKTLKWLVDNDQLQIRSVNGETLYKSKNSFLATDSSANGVSKYLPWIPYIENALMNPKEHLPARIQSYTGNFDQAAYLELLKAGDEYQKKFIELSDNSSTENAKVLYLQNIFFALASRE